MPHAHRRTAVQLIIYTVLVLVSASCVSPHEIAGTQNKYLECFRLDREPFDAELDARCTNPSARTAKVGTYHRDPTRELQADIIPVSIDADVAQKLPVSDCVWVGSSLSGAGDRLAPLWESTVDVDFTGDGAGNWHVTSCRLDPPHPRVSLNDDEVRSACIQAGVVYSINEPARAGDIKSTCDIDFSLFDLSLKRQPPAASSYGECGVHEEQKQTVNNYPSPAGACAVVNVLADDQVTFANTLLPREDSLYSVDGAIDRVLSPAVRTVMGTRSIARPLVADSPATWQTPIVVDGEPGEQRWQENFVDSVRVEQVRVFSVTDRVSDDREYLSLDGVTLTITDPDADSGVTNTCIGADESIDLLDCQIDVTPTYRPANLLRSNLTVLTAPLTWSIEEAAIEDNGREYFIEFDLVSTYRSRQAALLAEVPSAEFGGITVGDYDHTMIRFTNVGIGHFVIDSVMIAPQTGRPSAFLADRLDDPVMVPHPIYADETAKPGELLVGVEGWAAGSPMYELRESEHATELSLPFLHEISLELHGESVVFAGNTPVAQSSQPSFAGLSTMQGRTYPFNFPVYRRWSLPYTVAPGESRTVHVMARPDQPGELDGQLLVSGFPLHAPGDRQNVSVTLGVTGMTGPQADHIPTVMRFPKGSNALSTLNAVIVSYGDMDLTRGNVAITDSSDGLHAGDSQYFSIDGNTGPVQTMPPGSSELIRVTYDPGCFHPVPADGEHVAVLRIETDAGLREIALRGNSLRWRNSQAGCQAGY